MSIKRIIIAIVAVVGAVIVLAVVFGGQPDVKVDKAACRTALGTVIQDAANDSKSLKEFQAKMEALKSGDGSLNVSECKGQISDDEFNAVKKEALTDSTPVVKLAALKWAAASLSTPTPAATTAPAPVQKVASPSLTTEQQQAVEKANDYLDFTNFSKKGLIKQLAYDGFSSRDATVAVNSMKVDYNVQATKKGVSYLQLTAFSKAGLVRQLKYDGFTNTQAKLGAEGAFVVSD